MADLKLHLGCGKSVLPEYTGVDLSPQPGVSVVCDLSRKSWPFQDSSVERCVLFNLLDTFPTRYKLWKNCGVSLGREESCTFRCHTIIRRERFRTPRM